MYNYSKIPSLKKWKASNPVNVTRENNQATQQGQVSVPNKPDSVANVIKKLITAKVQSVGERFYSACEILFNRYQPEYIGNGYSGDEMEHENQPVFEMLSSLIKETVSGIFISKPAVQEPVIAAPKNRLIEIIPDVNPADFKPAPAFEHVPEKPKGKVFYFFSFNVHKILKVINIQKLFKESVKVAKIAVKAGNFVKYYIYRLLDFVYELMEKIAGGSSENVKQQYRTEIL